MCFTCYSEKYPEVKEKALIAKEKKQKEDKARRRIQYEKAKKWKEDHKVKK
jgi:hypothetical protein